MDNEKLKLKKTLASNIKKYRAKLKITQEQAAEKRGIALKYWQLLEMISQVDLPHNLKVNN